MVPPIAGLEAGTGTGRYAWLTEERLPRVRGVLLGLTLFFGLVVWVFHSLGPLRPVDPAMLRKLRGVGIMTWLYAMVQLFDLRFYHSRFARRRVVETGLPQSVIGWLFAQMLPWFGIVYYGITMDIRWYVAGLVLFLGSFAAFPIRRA